MDSVVGGVGDEGGGGRPDVGACVGDVFVDGVEGEDVGAGAVEEDEGYGVGGGVCGLGRGVLVCGFGGGGDG